MSKVDVSMNGIELQDREFFAAIREGREGREPIASVAKVLPCYRTLHQLEPQWQAAQLGLNGDPHYSSPPTHRRSP